MWNGEINAKPWPCKMTHGRRISIVGLGYVGLPVAISMARKNDPIIGFDISDKRIDELRRGFDSTNEVTAADLAQPGLKFTTDPNDLNAADFHIVAVPTPITETKQPDLGPLLAATRTIGAAIKAGDIIVYESTVYPGVTEEVCAPVLEEVSGLKCGKDFFLGYSPERINPGDAEHRFDTIVKVVSAQTPEALDIVATVYSDVISAGVHRAPNIRVAEAAKVIENTQRDLNIALMNELATIFERLDIDTDDVLQAAGTKWNFLPFSPGLVGGHCIGVDPYYLTHKAEQAGLNPQIILAGRRINDNMGNWIAQGTVKRLMRNGISDPSMITILGITFKEDVPDVRNTKVVDIISELQSFGITVQVHDPLADAAEVRASTGVELLPVDQLKPAQAIILAVPHAPFLSDGWSFVSGLIGDEEALVVDVRSKLPKQQKPDQVSLWRI